MYGIVLNTQENSFYKPGHFLDILYTTRFRPSVTCFFHFPLIVDISIPARISEIVPISVMKRLVTTILTVGLLSAVSAVQLIQRNAPNVVGLATQRRAVRNPIKRDGIRRRQTVTESLDNEATLYFANVSLGTPAQDLRLHIDTGSSDLWAIAKSSRICSYRGDPCSTSGTYDANSSSTYKYVSDKFTVSYVDGSGASGDYATDDLSIGGKTVKALQFGIGYNSSSTEGILGIGYAADESQVNQGNRKGYSNLPQAMADGGLIQSNAYSLWLDDIESSTGSILFGGVDTDKYHGQLQTLPIQKEFDQYAEFIITLSEMSLNNDGKITNFTTDLPTAVILDSGSSLTYLPNDLTSAIYNILQVSYSDREQTPFADCSLADQNITLDFTFTSPTISVPISELIINGETSDSSDRQDPNSQGGSGSSGGNDGSLCIFGIAPSEGATAVLGDTFLRSAYVVYDLANNEISLAQTNFNSTETHVSEISSGTAGVPGATSVVSAVEAAVSETGGARIAGVTGTITAGGSAATAGSGASSWRVSYTLLALAASIVVVLVGR